MKSLVVYYSQTNNTRKIAQAVSEGIRATGESCDMARLRDIHPADLDGYDLIGLGSPVWHRREPRHVMAFIESTMTSMEGRHGFVFCTHGLMPGRFFARLVPIMVQRGLTVIGWNNWYCSVTMPEKPKPYFTDGHPDDIDLAEARAFGAQMAQRSRDVFSGQTQLVPRLPTGAAYDALYPGTGSTGLPGGGYPRPDLDPQRAEMLVNQNFEFKVNKERCQFPKCTLCIDNCPMQSINLAVTPPIFARNCDRCWFCEQICPRGAIEVDWAPLADVIQRTVFQRFAALAQEAERKGAFRRLVPIEKVGRETPWYTLKKQPRLKLP